jgi:endonuclease-3
MKLDLKTRQRRADIINAELKRLYPHPHTILKWSNNWELYVAVALSAQCTDVQVNKVTDKLFKKYPTVRDYMNANIAEFEQDIFATGFYKNKAKNVLAAAQVYHHEFGEVMPADVEEIMKLPGAGRKTANVVLGNAYGLATGIAIDTHAKRLANRYGLTTHKTNADKIEQDLMALLPQEDWFNFTNRAIDYGREHCPARAHNHESCPLVIALQQEGLL